jgi:hypothetical protein
MSKKQNFSNEHFKADPLDRDLYTSSQIKERALNAAIVEADIEQGYEKCLAIFDTFYGDDIEVSSETGDEPIRGKNRVRSLRRRFDRNDSSDRDCRRCYRRDAFCLDSRIRRSFGRTNTASWRVFRKWNGSRVVYEYHYDQQQQGEVLTVGDLSFDAATPAPQFGRPS